MAYNPVSLAAIAGACESAGFEQRHRGLEITFEREHDRDPELVVVVYTSVRMGSARVRGRGRDAIRVALVSMRNRDKENHRQVGVSGCTRVHRTGTTEAILARMMQRVRELWVLANKMTRPSSLVCGRCRGRLHFDSMRCVWSCTGRSVPAPRTRDLLTNEQQQMMSDILGLEHR